MCQLQLTYVIHYGDFSFLAYQDYFFGTYLKTNLIKFFKVSFHVQDIDSISRVAQFILELILYPIVCASHMPLLVIKCVFSIPVSLLFFLGGGVVVILKILLWISNSFSLSVLCANHFTLNSSSAINFFFLKIFEHIRQSVCLGNITLGVFWLGCSHLDWLFLMLSPW